MLADELDYVVGVDTHLEEHVLAVVAAPSGAVMARRSVASSGRGYAAALRFAREIGNGRRVWRSRAQAATAPALPATWPAAARACSRSAARRGPSGACAAKTTRSTRRGLGGRRLPARRSRCRAAANAARR
jgi:transposase